MNTVKPDWIALTLEPKCLCICIWTREGGGQEEGEGGGPCQDTHGCAAFLSSTDLLVVGHLRVRMLIGEAGLDMRLRGPGVAATRCAILQACGTQASKVFGGYM